MTIFLNPHLSFHLPYPLLPPKQSLPAHLLSQPHQFHLPYFPTTQPFLPRFLSVLPCSVMLPGGHQKRVVRVSETLRGWGHLFAYSPYGSTDMGQVGRRQLFLQEPKPSKTWLPDGLASLFI